MATAFEELVPPFSHGDRLTREEFLRLWEAHPKIKNAELIGGMVFMASPVSRAHGDMDGNLGIWMGVYRVATPGTASGHNTTSFLLEDTPQPDLNLRVLPEYGGGSHAEGKYLGGVPELLTEICRSSKSYDMHDKLDLYEAARVPEYLAVLLHEREIRWHVMVDGKYQLLAPDADGLWRSHIFPGLWLDGAALLKGDMTQVLARLQDGINSPAHRAFVTELARRKELGARQA